MPLLRAHMAAGEEHQSLAERAAIPVVQADLLWDLDLEGAVALAQAQALVDLERMGLLFSNGSNRDAKSKIHKQRRKTNSLSPRPFTVLSTSSVNPRWRKNANTSPTLANSQG